MTDAEHSDSFDCFGSRCSVYVLGDGREESAAEALARARAALLEWHRRFSRFLPDSELARVNRDPRTTVPTSPLMARLASAVASAGAISGGLVDATLLGALETAGYRGEIEQPLALERALCLAPKRRPALPAPAPAWRQIEASFTPPAITRPPGVMIDSGGLAKGLFADALGETLITHRGFAIDCAGDLLIGGSGEVVRPLHVASPFDGSILHTFQATSTGIATSGIGRRSWLGRDGRPSHHLIDPSTAAAAFTGVVQVTALAPSALLAEIRAKAALLTGPRRARTWLPDGGVIVLDDGSHSVLAPAPRVSIARLDGRARWTGARAA